MPEIADRLERALGTIPDDVRERHVAGSAVCALSAATPPWVGTGLELEAGDAFSVFAAGRVVLSEEAGLFGGPRFYLWSRVGGRGPLLNGAQDTASFSAPQKGPIELGICLGEWELVGSLRSEFQ